MTKSRIILLLAVLVIAITGVIIRAYWVAPKLVDVENAIRDLWAKSGDKPAMLEGKPSFQILPPEFVLSQARITTEHGTSLQAERIGFRFGLFALVTGDYRITAINLDRSTIILPPDTSLPTKQATEKLLIRFVSLLDRAPTGATFDDIESIHFKNTQFRFSDHAAQFAISAPDVRLDRKASGTITLTGHIGIGGQDFATDLAIGPKPITLSDSRETYFSFESPTFNLKGQGTTALDENLQFLGTIAFSAQNMKAVASLLPNHVPPVSTVPAKLDAKARLSFTAVTLSDMHIRLGQSDITGNVVADFETATPRLTGTLAATTLDLSDFSNALGMRRNALGQWSTEPMPGNLVPDMEIDLRLSADTVVIHDLSISSVALSTLLRSRKAELTLASANFVDGSVTGKIEFSDIGATGEYDAQAHATFTKLDLEKLGLALLDSKRITGLASGRLSLGAKGKSSADMMSNLAGQIEITSDGNEIEGIDLLGFLRRLESRPVGAVIGFKSGKTEFDKGEMSLRVDSGVVELDKAKLTKFPELQVRLSGAIDLAKQNFAVTGHALASSAQSAERAIDLPFALQGPFNDPAFVPDFTNVSKQSGAITP